MGEKISFRLPDELADEMDARIEASFIHEDRSQFIRYAVRRVLNEPGEKDVTAGSVP